ncbi:glutamine--fructose-6-phosphate transaminase (isomerizing) [Candidatus Daviesbacteria bacterium]|nr:glutamine--fructose-6-phosphate transaminase (isomerizing) [Candidatus Daviesbacteria bacterium]
MCGIFGEITSKQDAPSTVFSGLKDIEYRGYDSWGIAFPQNGSLKVIKKVGFLPKTFPLPNSSVSIGHTRWATHGGVTEINAHPHTDCKGKIALVHNGIVENFLELKVKLKNHHFKSETDSEVIAHLIEEEKNKGKSLTDSASYVFRKLAGMNAIVVTDGKEIVACKMGSPLVVGKLKDGFALASDPNALLPLTNHLIFMEDEQIVNLNSQIKMFDKKGLRQINPKFKDVPWVHVQSELKKYPHFMLKEIYEQPEVLNSIVKNSHEIEKVSQLIKKAYGTFLIACGSASYSCLAGVYLFSKFAKKHVNFSIGSEFNYIQDYITPESLLIAVSQSGESMDTLEPVVQAKAKKAKIVGLVNVLGSTLYRIADYPLLLQAGLEKAVASTKALTAMFAMMILLAFTVVGKRKEAEEIIKQSALEISSILKRKNQIKKLADRLKSIQHIYILGRGLSYPVALETALKIKELSYIHSEGFAGGELKHGVIAMIEKGTPVIVYVPNDETKSAMLSNAMEVKARGAFVIGIGPESNPVFDFFFKVADVGASSMIPHIVFAQLLAYFLTTKLGHNPDKPRNLAKSVVVR